MKKPNGGKRVEKPEPLIKIEDVHKNYGKKVVHSGINLDIYQGEILTLMGGSGSGKSVLLRSLIGLDKPDRGHIWFHGQDIVGLKESQLVEVRKRIAYVFQYGALFDSFTVRENLAYPLRAHTKMTEDQIQQKVKESLQKVCLQGAEDLLPSGLSGTRPAGSPPSWCGRGASACCSRDRPAGTASCSSS